MNVLFIIEDALRPSHLGCGGYSKNTSPFMDKLASEGVLFKNVVGQSAHTLPGMVSAFTGVSVSTHGMLGPREIAKYDQYDFWKNFHQPFTIMKENGYTIAGKEPDFYNVVLDYQIDARGRIEELIKENKDNKFFFWYQPYCTHTPYTPAAPYDTMFLPEGYVLPDSAKERMKVAQTAMITHKPGILSRFETGEIVHPDDSPADNASHGRSVGSISFAPEDKIPITAAYDGCVRELDNTMEKYCKLLDELGILDDTMIVISSDHGEELLERGSLGHASCSLAGTLYDEDIMIPLIIRYPKGLPSGVVIDRQISQIDIMPTLLDIMGLEKPEGTQGTSMLPLINGGTVDAPQEAYSATPPCGWQYRPNDLRVIHSLRTPEWKLIYNADPNGENYYELYNLKDDPEERIDIHPRGVDEIAEPLKKRLHELMIK